MAELKDEMAVLEAKIGQLRVLYEQYFTKQIKLEPARLREEIERLILFHSNKPISSTTLKFRFNSAVAKYNSYKQYWNRTLRAIAEGTLAGRSETGAVVASTPLDNRLPEVPAQQPQPRAAGFDVHLAEAYKNYIEAKRKCNEPVEGLSYEAFAKTIENAARKAKETYRTDSVELKVTIKDGKTKLTIAPKEKQE